MHVTTVASYKGGSGKTTTAINLSYNLSTIGKKVLLIDLDPSKNSTQMIGKKGYKGDIYDVFMDWCLPLSAIHKTRFKNLFIIPGSNELEKMQLNQADRLDAVCKILKKHFDFIIIDCHPNMQPATINALVAADNVIIPMKPDYYNLDGLGLMDNYIEQIKNYNPNISYKVLITMHRLRGAGRWKVVQDLIERTNTPVYDTFIREREAVNSSQAVRKPLLLHRSKDASTLDYMQFTQEYLQEVKKCQA